MHNDQIVSRMNTYLHTAAVVLADWLGDLLPKVSDDWWENCVLDKLSYNQRELAESKGYDKLSDLDLAALLRVADRSWYAMQGVAFLNARERECIRDMMGVRNNWAHMSVSLPGKDTILHDLATIYNFFEQRECESSLLDEVSDMIGEVKSPTTVDLGILTGEEQKLPEHISEGGTADVIAEKSLVYLVGDPSIRGIVMSVSDLGDTKKYDVFVDGRQVDFRRSRAKELFAYLIDINGAQCTTVEAASAIWEDEADVKVLSHRIRNLIADLRTTLDSIGQGNVLVRKGKTLSINRDLIDCDYYQMLSGSMEAVNSYRGEYMTQYSWATLTEGNLYFRLKK